MITTTHNHGRYMNCWNCGRFMAFAFKPYKDQIYISFVCTTCDVKSIKSVVREEAVTPVQHPVPANAELLD